MNCLVEWLRAAHHHVIGRKSVATPLLLQQVQEQQAQLQQKEQQLQQLEQRLQKLEAVLGRGE